MVGDIFRRPPNQNLECHAHRRRKGVRCCGTSLTSTQSAKLSIFCKAVCALFEDGLLHDIEETLKSSIKFIFKGCCVFGDPCVRTGSLSKNKRQEFGRRNFRRRLCDFNLSGLYTGARLLPEPPFHLCIFGFNISSYARIELLHVLLGTP